MSGSPSSSYNKLWALGTAHASTASSPLTDTVETSHEILESLKKRRGAETAQWLNTLVDPNQIPATTTSQDTQPIENPGQQQLIRLLDKLFDQFELFTAQFNRTAKGTDLAVAITRPILVEQQKDLSDEMATNSLAEKTYEGHLVTRYWAMLLRGTASAVNVFIIPAEILLGFSLHKIDESAYSPLLVIESSLKDNQLTWHIAGTGISISQIQPLAKELFGDLIRVASGQMSDTELFAHPLQELSLGENLAVGYKMPSHGGKEPIAQTNNLTASAAAPTNVSQNISLASLDLGQKMLASIDSDIDQLFNLGKAALTSEDTSTFKKIELLTEKMQTLKEAFKSALSEVTKFL